jgi:Lipoprotein LpqB beta-propeller domain/Sporulation and spore germination
VTVRATRPTRRTWAGLLLPVAACLLASCMQVPDSGPVHAGPEVGAETEPLLRYVPSGPQPGADPVTTVNGYLDAMRAYPPNPGIVRQFLTEDAAASWAPGAGTQIYAASPELEQVDSDTVRVDGRLRATLSELGTWTTPSPGERRVSREFRLRRVHGEWRITDPAPGLLLPEYDFERYYGAYSLYFFDPALRVLVPSPVYLPEGTQTATLLLRGLVRGPTEWLGGAVRSLVPPTDAADLSVPVTDEGVAQVQLGPAARGLGATERGRLAAQLAWTLRQVPDVDTIRVTVNGAPLPLEAGDNTIDVDTGAEFDPTDAAAAQTLYALRADRLETVDLKRGKATPVGGRFGSGDVPVRTYAVERSGQTVAAVTQDGTAVEVAPLGADDSQVWLSRATSLLGVQWDIHDLLWAVDRTSSGTRVYVMRDGRVEPVALPGDAPDDVTAFALSRDGVRLAVVQGSGDASRLLVGRVVRPTDDSLRISVDRWREVVTGGTSLSRFVDVAWQSPTELTVVGEETLGSAQVFTVSVDGSTVTPTNLLDLDLASVADAADVDRPTVVATRPGTLYLQLADRWTELALDGRFREPSYVE